MIGLMITNTSFHVGACSISPLVTVTREVSSACDVWENMSTKQKQKADDTSLSTPPPPSGLASTNLGVILQDLLLSSHTSWTLILLSLLLAALFIRVVIGLGGYSGT